MRKRTLRRRERGKMKKKKKMGEGKTQDEMKKIDIGERKS